MWKGAVRAQKNIRGLRMLRSVELLRVELNKNQQATFPCQLTNFVAQQRRGGQSQVHQLTINATPKTHDFAPPPKKKSRNLH